MNSIQNTSFKQFDPDLGIIKQDQLSIRQPNVGEASGPAGTQEAGKSGSFFEQLEKSMSEVNADQLQADTSIKELVAGKSKNIHETMLQIQKAELSLKAMMQVRNKMLEAYKEIIRMQV